MCHHQLIRTVIIDPPNRTRSSPMTAHLPLQPDQQLSPSLRRSSATAQRTHVAAPVLFPAVRRSHGVSSADAYARYGGLGLTSTQSHVLALMAEGRTNGEIATELQITQDQATHRVQDVLSV